LGVTVIVLANALFILMGRMYVDKLKIRAVELMKAMVTSSPLGMVVAVLQVQIVKSLSSVE